MSKITDLELLIDWGGKVFTREDKCLSKLFICASGELAVSIRTVCIQLL